MQEPGWKTELRRRALETRRMILKPGDPGPLPVTKIGGTPWWPKGLARPICGHRHEMAFLAQVLLGDVPQFSTDPALLSFHYCEECARNGRMSWGRGDGGQDVRLFPAVSESQPDGRGVVADSSLPPHRVTLSAVEEIPGFEDISEEQRDRIPTSALTAKDDFDEHVYRGLVHVRRCKVGGWPSWQQSPEWPECPKSGRMTFVAQIDWDLGRDMPWAGGGYAYLFACPASCRATRAELVIQTT